MLCCCRGPVVVERLSWRPGYPPGRCAGALRVRERVPDVPESTPAGGAPSRALLRRDLLRLAGVAVTGAALAACTTSPAPGPTTASPGAPDDPDLALRSEVAAEEAALSELYAGSAPVLPAALRARVTALGSRHADYRAAVIAGATISATPTASPTSTGSASASLALGRLRAAEKDAAASRAAQSVRATDPELARVIALAGTGAAGAAEVLRGLR